MKYRVIGEGGEKFGLVGIGELAAMMADGRILPSTLIEDETGARATAGDILGRNAPPIAPPAATVPVVSILVGCGVAFVGFIVLVAILFPVFAQARVRAQRQRTLVNARQLGRAVLMYAEDNDQLLPLDLSTARAAQPVLGVYIADDRAYTTFNPAGGEFLGNPKISGSSLKSYPSLRQIVLFYESREWRDRRRIVLWLDGHASTPADFDAARDVGRGKGR